MWTMAWQFGQNRSKISDRIYDVLVTDLRKGYEVVNVNEPGSDLAIHCLEIETAGQAPAAVVGDATAPSLGVSFVCVDRHLQRPPSTKVPSLGPSSGRRIGPSECNSRNVGVRQIA